MLLGLEMYGHAIKSLRCSFDLGLEPVFPMAPTLGQQLGAVGEHEANIVLESVLPRPMALPPKQVSIPTLSVVVRLSVSPITLGNATLLHPRTARASRQKSIWRIRHGTCFSHRGSTMQQLLMPHNCGGEMVKNFLMSSG